MMQHNPFFLSAAMLSLAAIAAPVFAADPALPPAQPAKPNVVVIFCDDLEASARGHTQCPLT